MLTDRRRRSDIPMLGWFFGYQKDCLRYDVIAGLITAAVVVPKAMDYVTIAALSVKVGLSTALLAMVIYAVVGAFRLLRVSTGTSMAILAGGLLGHLAPVAAPAALLVDLAMLTLLVGAVLSASAGPVGPKSNRPLSPGMISSAGSGDHARPTRTPERFRGISSAWRGGCRGRP